MRGDLGADRGWNGLASCAGFRLPRGSRFTLTRRFHNRVDGVGGLEQHRVDCICLAIYPRLGHVSWDLYEALPKQHS